MGCSAQRVLDFLVECGPKTDFGPVEQNAQVFPLHPKFPTDLVFVLIFQEHSAKQPAVPWFHFGQNIPHFFLCLLGNQHALKVDNLAA
jgi:hypothetical protein